MPIDHDEENEKDRNKAALMKPSLADRMKKVFAGISGRKAKQNIGGHEQDNHSEVQIMRTPLKFYFDLFYFYDY